MPTEKFDSMMKETLKNLCCSNGWCYGVVWGFDQRDSLLLTLKVAYYEEQIGALIDSMLLQAHVVGRGIIGQAAFEKNHRWMDSDAHHERRNCVGSFDSLDVFQEDSEFFCQFSMGIKTIAVIPVEPWGVVELGSTQKNSEMKDFVDQVQLLFRGMDESPEIEDIGNDSRFFHSSMQIDSALSSGIFHSEGVMGADHSLVLPSQPFPSTSDSQSRNLIFAAASSIENPMQNSSSQLEQFLLESGNFFDCSATYQDLSSYSDCSLLTSAWPHLASGIEDSTSLSEPRDHESCKNSSLNSPANLSSTFLQPQQFSKDMSNTQSDFKAQRLSGLLTVEEFFAQGNFAKAVSKPAVEDDLSQLISPHIGNALTALTAQISTDMSHSTALIPGSGLSGSSTPIHKVDNLPTNSLQSSVTYAFRSSGDAKCSGMEKRLDTMGVEHGRQKPMVWSETLIPESECITEKNVGSKMSNSNSLFSKLGLDQILDGIASTSHSFDRSRFEDQSSSAAKRRKIDNFSWSQNQVKFEGSSFDGKMRSVYNPEAKNVEGNSEDCMKEPRSCIGDSCTMDAAKTSSSRRQEEPVKTKKKKAKPGTRPRPKDRQMIQDRLAELRELIPNGEKMSIDRLLERTIRHLNFMQSLTRHAESLKQIAKPKSTEARRNHSINGGDGGVTWAYEVGNDGTMFCPLIVEDLSTPSQMLIEILCEEQGFFLEIVEIIRGFGLNILKGVMEVRETKKIWAHFMVEAEGSRCVTRHEIFSSLIQLFQMTGQSVVNEGDCYGNVISSAMPAFNNFEHAASFPVNFPDALQCASL